MLRQSSKTESGTHALLGASITGTVVSIHQYIYSQGVFDILRSGSAQFATTLVNGYINLRIYDFSKRFLLNKFPNLTSKQVIYLSAAISSCETFFAVYCIQEFLAQSKNSFHIALGMQFLTLIGLGGIYENILKHTSQTKNS